jgi:hypothetical protein
MKSPFRTILDLCLLRGGPQDLPYSARLTQLLLLLVVGFNLIHIAVLDGGSRDVSQLSATIVMLVLLPWVLLRMRNRSERYLQTLAALAGTGVMFILASMPLTYQLAEMLPLDPEVKPTPRQLWVSLGALVLVGWKLAINGNIWRHAMDFPKFAGLLLALALVVVELAVLQMLATPAAAAG